MGSKTLENEDGPEGELRRRSQHKTVKSTIISLTPDSQVIHLALKSRSASAESRAVLTPHGTAMGTWATGVAATMTTMMMRMKACKLDPCR